MPPRPSNTLRKLIDGVGPVDAIGIEERVVKYGTRSIKKNSKLFGLRLAASMIDLTTLEGKDSEGKVKQLCYKAMHPHDALPGVPQVAAVCVYPTMVRTARKALKGSNINVASVATAFPSGLAPMKVKLEDTRFAVSEGADEIDMVISRGKFLQGEFNFVFDEIAAVKEACGKAHLKVILETGELSTLDNVRRASDLAIRAGADFIKTSTGKETVNATLPVSLTMIRCIRDYQDRTGIKVGYKPAGGISKAKDALMYLALMKDELGHPWLQPDLFRFGASSLLGDIERQLEHYLTGHYSAANRHAMG